MNSSSMNSSCFSIVTQSVINKPNGFFIAATTSVFLNNSRFLVTCVQNKLVIIRPVSCERFVGACLISFFIALIFVVFSWHLSFATGLYIKKKNVL